MVSNISSTAFSFCSSVIFHYAYADSYQSFGESMAQIVNFSQEFLRFFLPPPDGTRCVE